MRSRRDHRPYLSQMLKCWSFRSIAGSSLKNAKVKPTASHAVSTHANRQPYTPMGGPLGLIQKLFNDHCPIKIVTIGGEPDRDRIDGPSVDALYCIKKLEYLVKTMRCDHCPS